MSGRVCVIGSFMTDLTAHVARRPVLGETVIGESFAETLGGKGFNQAVAAARAGAAVTMLGCVGVDARGDAFVAALGAHGIDHSGVIRSTELGTGVGLPLVEATGLNSIVVVPQANTKYGPSAVEHEGERIGAADVVCVQLELGLAVAITAARIARRAGRAVLVNPAPADADIGGLLALATHVVPNDVEAAVLAGRRAGTAPAECAVALREAWPDAEVIVTCGEAGAVYVDATGTTHVHPAPHVRAVDTVGAGDTFCGYLAARIAARRPLSSSIDDAVAAASDRVTRNGAIPWRRTGERTERSVG